MSSNDSGASRVRALKLGAHDYWTKPLNEFQLKSLWKCTSEDPSQKDTGCLIRGISDNSDLASSMLRRSNNNFEEGHDVDESCNSPPAKKPRRVVWDEKLHGVFLNAIQKIGIESMMCCFSLFINICISSLVFTVSLFFTLFVLDVVPKKILVAMNVPGLERGHVASHLQVSFYVHFIFFLYFIIILLLLIVAKCELKFLMARNTETL